MCALEMIRIYINFAGTNKGGGKPKRCSITEVVNENSNNENPSFELKTRPCIRAAARVISTANRIFK